VCVCVCVCVCVHVCVCVSKCVRVCMLERKGATRLARQSQGARDSVRGRESVCVCVCVCVYVCVSMCEREDHRDNLKAFRAVDGMSV